MFAYEKQRIVRKISLMVQMGSNPHHSWLGLTEQQNLTLFRVEARVIVQGNGIVVLLQWLWEWKVWWAIPQSCDR